MMNRAVLNNENSSLDLCFCPKYLTGKTGAILVMILKRGISLEDNGTQRVRT